MNNEVGTSGIFLGLARGDQLLATSELVLAREQTTKHLEEVKRHLQSCNHPVRLAEYVLFCLQHRRDFGTALHKLVERLELEKQKLQHRLSTIDQQLAAKQTQFEWAADYREMNSLVPRIVRRTPDSVVSARNKVIDENLHRSTEEICRILDQEFKKGNSVYEYLPRTWAAKCKVETFVQAYRHKDCRNLVHKLISTRRRGIGYPST